MKGYTMIPHEGHCGQSDLDQIWFRTTSSCFIQVVCHNYLITDLERKSLSKHFLGICLIPVPP